MEFAYIILLVGCTIILYRSYSESLNGCSVFDKVARDSKPKEFISAGPVLHPCVFGFGTNKLDERLVLIKTLFQPITARLDFKCRIESYGTSP